MEEKDLIDCVPLAEKDLITQIINEEDPSKVRCLTDVFNLHQKKKDILRSMKYNELLDHVSNEMLERFLKYPDQFTNAELVKYLDTIQNANDKAIKSINNINETPLIQINNNYNPEEKKEELTKEERENILNVIKLVMNNTEKEIIIEEDDNEDE